MSLNEAVSLTYRVAAASAAASSAFLRPIQARVAERPAFPSQVVLLNEISDRLRVVQPILVDFEEGDEGRILVSDSIFYMYGEGATRMQALRDYISSLAEYYELLESHDDEPSVALFRHLQSYLQPIGR
jgi:hypothetical protein